VVGYEEAHLAALLREVLVALNERKGFGGGATRARQLAAETRSAKDQGRNFTADAQALLAAYGLYVRDRGVGGAGDEIREGSGLAARTMDILADAHGPPPIGRGTSAEHGDTPWLGSGLEGRAKFAAGGPAHRLLIKGLTQLDGSDVLTQEEKVRRAGEGDFWLGVVEEHAGECGVERQAGGIWGRGAALPNGIARAIKQACEDICRDTENQGAMYEWRARADGTGASEPHRAPREEHHRRAPRMSYGDINLIGECGQEAALTRFRDGIRLNHGRENCPLCGDKGKEWKCGHMSDAQILDIQDIEEERHGMSPFLIGTDGGNDPETEEGAKDAQCTAAAVLCVLKMGGSITETAEDSEKWLSTKWQGKPEDSEWRPPVLGRAGKRTSELGRLVRPLLAWSAKLPDRYGYEASENTLAEIVAVGMAEMMLPIDVEHVVVTDAEAARDAVFAARRQEDTYRARRKEVKKPYEAATTVLHHGHVERHWSARQRVAEEGDLYSETWRHRLRTRRLMKQAEVWGENEDYPMAYTDQEGLAAGTYVYNIGVDSHQVTEEGYTHKDEAKRRYARRWMRLT
jgi:hypothetical protein